MVKTSHMNNMEVPPDHVHIAFSYLHAFNQTIGIRLETTMTTRRLHLLWVAPSPTMSSADPLLELLSPQLIASPYNEVASSSTPTDQVKTTLPDPLSDPLSPAYLSHLSSLSLSSILSTEPAALQATSQSLNVAIQSLSSRSHKALITSSKHLSTLSTSVSEIRKSIKILSTESLSGPPSINVLDHSIQTFLQKFQKDSAGLRERSNAHLLSRNLDRILDVLELPTLLSSSISSGNYPTSLDILAHVRRLTTLYPNSPTILSISRECEGCQRVMVSNLIGSLMGSIKLPTAIKTVGWLKRAVPDIGQGGDIARGIFLVCRLSWVEGLFQALEPLKELAEEEREQRLRTQKGRISNIKSAGLPRRGDVTPGAGGQHTERYLKRWIEIFREQSFAVVSMYRSIFPDAAATTTLQASTAILGPGSIGPAGTSPLPSPNPYAQKSHSQFEDNEDVEKGLPPSPLTTFILHLIMLLETALKAYLANIQDKSARESLLTQVLYAAGSLGRLGGDFSGIVACLGQNWDEEDEGSDEGLDEDIEEVEEWVEVMKKHRVLASRLEQLASGGGVAK